MHHRSKSAGARLGRRTERQGLARRLKAAGMAALLVVSNLLTTLGYMPKTALAAEGSVTVTSSANVETFPDINVPFRNFHIFEVSGGNVADSVAYCGDKTMSTPTVGMTLSGGYTLNNAMVDYILYHGYSSSNTTGYGCTPGKFYVASQYALWLALPDSNGSHAEVYDELSRTYTVVQNAVNTLMSEAEAYASAGGGGVEAGTAVYWPSPDGVHQGLVTRQNPTGSLSIQKSSTNPAITDGNECYSLEGAVYGVYSDSGCTSEVGRMTTDASGAASISGLRIGTYYVREISAPTGYAADDTVHTVTVNSGSDTHLNVTDSPVNDPVNFVVQKVDSQGSSSAGWDAQGNATVEGAQFTVRFYEGYYDSVDALPSSPDRTWVIETRLVGTKVRAFLSDDYKVSGDPWYAVDGTGAAILPLGTFTVQETKAPDGYLISDSNVHLGQVVADDDSYFGASVKKIGDWTNTFDQEDAGAGLAIVDQVITGGISVPKIDHELDDNVSQGDATLAGAVISIANASEGEVVVDGTRYQSGQEVMTITTGADGTASTGAHDLPYGTYRLTEKSAPSGYLLNTEWSVTVSVQEDGVIVPVPDEDALDDTVIRGGGGVQKVDSDSGTPSSQGDATLEGAEIDIYNRSDSAVLVDGVVYQPGQVVMTLQTNAQGAASTEATALPYGTYEARERSASEGYLVNEDWSQTFEVRTDGQVVTLDDLSEPIIRGGVTVRKVDADWATSDPQGDATLAGAEIQIINRSAAAVYVDGAWYQPGEVVKTIVTGEDGVASTSDDCLPYGTYELVESKAPTGYTLNTDWSQTIQIRSDGQMSDLTSEAEAVRDEVIRGGVTIRKVDRELLASSEGEEPYGGAESASLPLGGATLAGAQIQIVNNSDHAVRVEGSDYQPGEVVKTIVTGEDGVASTSDDCLPYGTYVARESVAPTGYLLNTDWSQTFEIREDGVMVDLTSDENAVADQVIRGDIELQKHDEDSQSAMAGIPFKITSRTTGEWHIAVTDENGVLNTSAGWNPHETSTNANDEALLDDGTVDDSRLDANAGVWFSGRADAATTPDDSLGALPFDTYTVEELRCAANEGHRLVSTTARVTRNNVTIDLGTFDDKEVAIATTLNYGDSSSRSVPATGEVTLTDTVRFEELERGADYELSSEIHAIDRNGNDTGIVATALTRFTPKLSADTVDVTFTLDTSSLQGMTLVCFEYLYEPDGLDPIASHEDLEDLDQTLYVPAIGTTLISDVTSDHDGPSYADSKMTDTARLENLVIGEDYTLTGTLHLRAADGSDAGAVTDADGIEVAAETTFTATSRDMSVQLTFDVPTSSLAGKTVVAFETLSNAQGELASHADISDEGQSVHLPAVATEAISDATGDHQGPQGGDQTITDTVSLKNLVVGKTYTVSGELHLSALDGEGNLIDEGVLRDSQGNEATAETTFVADAVDMEVELSFTADTSALGGRDIVAFEELYRDDILLASHSEISDSDQTVHIPEVETTATSEATGDHDVPAYESQTVTDVVHATNLVVGKTYDVSGSLHVQTVSEDGTVTDAGALTDADGNEIVASTSFVATDTTMDVTLTFDIDASQLRGQTVVAFETLSSEGVTLVVHADINDASQTVFVPSVTTTATSDATSDHDLPALSDQVVNDSVSLSNLVVGATYTVRGTLHLVERDDDGNVTDAGALTDADGNEVTAETTFTADQPNMTVDLEFPVDGSAIAGRDTVAFEQLWHGSVMVADHSDISDEGQTTHVPEIHTTATDKADEDHEIGAYEQQTVVDVVDLHNLLVGKTYVLTGTLHLKGADDDGNATDAGALTDADGNEVTASKTFEATSQDMSVELEFTLDASQLAGETIVAFEELTRNDVTVATHADISDADQSVMVPEIGTTLVVDGTDSHEYQLVPGEDGVTRVTLTDTVAYENLTPGEAYVVTGTLMDADSGQPVQASHLVTVREVVDPETGEWREVAEGRVDSDDGSWTETTLTANDDGSWTLRVTGPDGEISQTKLDDTEVRTSEHWEEGAVSSNAAFVAAGADGTVEVAFAFDAAGLEGHRLVAFEELRNGTQLVADHSDLADPGQTVSFVDIATTATDAVDGDHEVLAAPNAEVVDTVSYEGLTPGVTYELSGELHLVGEDGTDAGVLTNQAGEPVKATAQLIPETTSGSAEVRFSFDASGMEGMSAVAFEELKRDGVTIATHADISDEGQTVTFSIPPEEYPNTGQDAGAVVAIGAGALGLTGLAVYLRRRRSVAQS